MKRVVLLLLLISIVSCKNEKPLSGSGLSAKEKREVLSEKLDTLKLISWRSRIAWRAFAVNKSHTGKMVVDSGYITVNKNNKIRGGEFYINMASISVVDLKGVDKEYLESHLKGTIKGKEDHFFNTKKYPQAIFTIVDNYEMDEENILEGDLKLKAQENFVEGFPITITKTDNMLVLNAKNFKIDRTEWGITYASSSFFDDLKDKAIGDDFIVNIKAVFADKARK